MRGRITPVPAVLMMPAIPDRAARHWTAPRPAWPHRRLPPPAGPTPESLEKLYFSTGRTTKSLFLTKPILLCPETLLLALGYRQLLPEALFWVVTQIPVISIGNLKTPAAIPNYCTKPPHLERLNQFSVPVNLSMTDPGITLRA